MIAWLLSKLDANPHTVFSESELRALDEDAFEQFRSAGLLERLPDLQAGDGYSLDNSGRVLTVVASDEGFEALDLNDLSFPPVSLDEAARRRWQVRIDGLIEKFRKVNGLTGPYEALESNLFLLGQRDLEDGSIACCMALVGRRSFISALAPIPALLGQKYPRVVVVTRRAPSLTESVRLEVMGITVSPLLEADPLRVTKLRLPGGLFFDSGIFRNDDYSTVVWRDQTFNLLRSEALVIQVLHAAFKSPSPEVAEEKIIAQLQHARLSDASDLRDVLRRSGVWMTLVVAGKRRGFYCLDIP